MLSCFQFHLYAGVRAGGGIGDELDPPGDEDFYWRFAFDITFFFFIIVIMLAIIQVKPTFSPLFRREILELDESSKIIFLISGDPFNERKYENVLI